ncbi:terpene cyclase/mutase family protein [Bacillus sp. KH172YL63]|uniref:terpene cyclase/mutase family protein n=1 Tax=Bacillus sp. KH172YL63 TaxID=2709784 RepID=UPI0013E4CCCA|nr:prenyltransferase/squalene oxidase repeat-containing protein [Bacillus sp. KH172YL63]BCB02698.1 squalene--hopene cyclase [Bacillus sp. KH172YL63]
MKKKIEERIRKLVSDLQERQDKEGSWHFCFENSVLTDAYMIILLCSLETGDEELVGRLVGRLWKLQTREGTWKLFEDEEEGNLSSTVEACFALTYSGLVEEGDKRLIKAKQFIEKKGGFHKAHSMTKFMLAIHGQYEWKHLLPVPIELLLLPKSSPLSFWDFSSYGRGHIAPLMLLKDRGYSFKSPRTPDIQHLSRAPEEIGYSSREIALLKKINEGLQSLPDIPAHLHQQAQQFALHYMLQRIESDGTYLSYFTTTFYMIYALLSLGYEKSDPIIVKAVDGVKKMACETKKGTHIQNSPSTVWDTALISHSLQEAGVDVGGGTVRESVDFIMKKQQFKYGDWAVESGVTPGGWGFSISNSFHPDVDDTTAALRAVTYSAAKKPFVREAWERGTEWVLAMQNRDGGWPAFEKNKTKDILTSFPLDGAEAAAIDPSTPDLTGRTLEFLGGSAGLTQEHPGVEKAVRWLNRMQNEDGSWYGRWGVCYIYGTWSAITGMRAAGVPSTDRSLQRAKSWLEDIQQRDGGWGESCYSDQKKTYIPLPFSTVSQTAWALEALIHLEDKPTPAIDLGITALLGMLDGAGDALSCTYPTGIGLPGQFYVHYHSYQSLWPLLTLSLYQKKYVEGRTS